MECKTFSEFIQESLKLTNSDQDVFIKIYKSVRGRNVKGQLNSYYGLGLKVLRIDIKQRSKDDVSTAIRIKGLTESTYKTELRGFLRGSDWKRIGKTSSSSELI